MHARGDTKATPDAILAEQDQRDRRDAERDSGPMVPAPDAILVNTTHLTPEQVVDRLELEVRRCWSSSSTSSTS